MVSSKTPQINRAPFPGASTRIAVAFSGGIDSTALLHSTVAAHGPENVIALHVNHGLQQQADSWVIHCAKIANEFEVFFDFRLVQLETVNQLDANIEARARQARYDALREMCLIHSAEHLLFGHHQDDQAETFLLQLIRGSGLLGLAGMPPVREDFLSEIRIWRPFLELTRDEIESYANTYQLEWIEDPTNANEQLTRNFVRKKLLPLFEKIQPQFKNNIGRSASHLRTAQSLLDQLADIDLNVMTTELGLEIKNLLSLRKEDLGRSSNVLRRWLFLQGIQMPSEERLHAWWHDLEGLSHETDHQLSWLHDGLRLNVWRGKLSVTEASESLGIWTFKLLDESSADPGVPIKVYQDALSRGDIYEKERIGGEKFRLDLKRPRRSLKNLFQELDIPPWKRDAPLLYLGEEILAIAGVGVNAEISVLSGKRMAPVFEKQKT